MSIFYDNGQVQVFMEYGDIVLVSNAGANEYASLSSNQAREIAAALLKAAEEKEEILK